MSLALTIFIGLVIVVLGLIGYFRDPRQSLLTLLGTLFGAVLVDFWGAPWGAWISSTIGGDQQRNTFIASSLIFLWGALLVGYGGALLLGRLKERPSVRQRLVSILFGLVNGVLLAGFLLRYAVVQQPAFAAMVRATPAASVIHDGLPLLFLAVAAAVTLAVLVRAVASLFSRPPAPQPAASPAAPASAAAGADRRLDDRGVLNRVNDASRR